MLILYSILLLLNCAHAATIDDIYRNGIKIFGVDSKGKPASVLSINEDGTLKGISLTAYGIKVDPLAIFQSSNVSRSTSANVTLTSVQILGGNPDRRCLYIWNNGANSAYITFGTTSSSASPTAIVPSFTSFVMANGTIYTGPIAAVRNAGAGTMVSTECVP
jgi:hypothetical protein